MLEHECASFWERFVWRKEVLPIESLAGNLDLVKVHYGNITRPIHVSVEAIIQSTPLAENIGFKFRVGPFHDFGAAISYEAIQDFVDGRRGGIVIDCDHICA